MRRKNNNVFWGIALIGAAIILLLSSSGIINIAYKGVFFALILVALAINSLIKQKIFNSSMLLGLAYTVLPRGLFIDLGIDKITNFFLVMLIALLLGIGLEMIFGKKNKFTVSWRSDKDKYRNFNKNKYERSDNMEYYEYDEEQERTFSESEGGEYVNRSVTFSDYSLYLDTNNFRHGDFDVQFGELNVYFTDVELKHNMIINVSCNLGGAKIYVPKSWKIDDQVSATLGNVDVINNQFINSDYTLTIAGNVNLGDVKIIFV